MLRKDADVDIDYLRLAVYRSFARTGRVPESRALAKQVGGRPADVRAGMRQLAEQRHVVVGDADEVVMAHPFSAVPLGFAVMGARTLWWGGCAWDSFALPHLLAGSMPELLLDHEAVLVSTRCPACGHAHAWTVSRQHPPTEPTDEQVAHFRVPAARMWDDVVHTCSHQRIFCSTVCVDRWLADTGQPRGYVMDLTTLWRLAAHWYDGRLDRGYQRRDPAHAAEYLRSVGLAGPFWGL
jgi:Alkylmercury lyase